MKKEMYREVVEYGSLSLYTPTDKKPVQGVEGDKVRISVVIFSNGFPVVERVEAIQVGDKKFVSEEILGRIK